MLDRIIKCFTVLILAERVALFGLLIDVMAIILAASLCLAFLIYFIL
jgi:hypothetical protein